MNGALQQFDRLNLGSEKCQAVFPLRKQSKTEVIRTGTEACSILNALIWDQKSDRLFSLIKKKRQVPTGIL